MLGAVRLAVWLRKAQTRCPVVLETGRESLPTAAFSLALGLREEGKGAGNGERPGYKVPLSKVTL